MNRVFLFIITYLLLVSCSLIHIQEHNANNILTQSRLDSFGIGQDTIELEYRETKIVPPPKMGYHVIENREQFIDLCGKRKQYPDFNNYVIMGFTSVLTKQTEINNRLYLIKSQKKVVLDITIFNKPGEQWGVVKSFWILVKRPKKHDYNYEVLHKSK